MPLDSDSRMLYQAMLSGWLTGA